MAAFYIQTNDNLVKLSGDLSYESITEALGYTPFNSESINGYATEQYVITKIADAKLDGSDIEIPVEDVKVNGKSVIDANRIANIEIPEVDFTGYATETYVDNKFDSIEIPEVDFTGYATEQWVEDKNYLTEHQDVSMLATKDELNNLDFYKVKNNPVINGIDDSFIIADEDNNVGLQLTESGLYVKDVFSGAHQLSQKADKSELDSKVNISDLPNLDEYATTTDVNAKFNNVQSIAMTASNDVSAMKGRVSTLENAGYATETYVDGKFDSIEIPEVDFTGYATEEYVDNSIKDFDFYSMDNNPIVKNEPGKLIFADESGNFGLCLESDNTLHVTDVVAGDHVLSAKADLSLVSELLSELQDLKEIVAGLQQ